MTWHFAATSSITHKYAYIYIYISHIYILYILAQDFGPRVDAQPTRLALREQKITALKVEGGTFAYFVCLPYWHQKLKNMKKGYLVCHTCKGSWIWQERLQSQPQLTCNICGSAWQRHVPDLRRQKQRQVQWASWNFAQQGARWPAKSYKDALLDAPLGLAGGAPKKKNKKVKQSALQKAVQEHWGNLPDALRLQCEAMGIQATEPPPPPDLPTLLKEHLSSLPSDLKDAVEKIVEPTKQEPTIATKLKQSVGTLKQLTEKKASLQAKADGVKQQYSALLQELKELQTKIEGAQKELQDNTTQYNKQLEQDKQAADEANVDPDEITAEKLMIIMSNVGLHATAEQVQTFASKLSENAVKRRKCG